MYFAAICLSCHRPPEFWSGHFGRLRSWAWRFRHWHHDYALVGTGSAIESNSLLLRFQRAAIKRGT